MLGSFPRYTCIQSRAVLTRTRLLTAACTAATGADRSGIAFPSTSPSSCIITRWDICWATGSRILSIVFVWKTGMVTTLYRYPRQKISKSPNTQGSLLSSSRYKSLLQSLWPFQDSWSLPYEHYNYSREPINVKTPCRGANASNSNVTGAAHPLTNKRARTRICLHLVGRSGCQSRSASISRFQPIHPWFQHRRVC